MVKETGQADEDGLGLVNVVDDGFAGGGAVAAADGVNDGAMEGLKAHLLTLDADGIGHAVSEAKGAFEDAAFEAQELAIVGHSGKAEMEGGVELGAMVRAFA